MRLSAIMTPFSTQESSPDIAPGGKELLAPMREYLTAAKSEYLANDTAEGFVQRMRAAPSFD